MGNISKSLSGELSILSKSIRGSFTKQKLYIQREKQFSDALFLTTRLVNDKMICKTFKNS